MDMEEMLSCMQMMAEKMPKENGQLFEKLFMVFLQLFLVSLFSFREKYATLSKK